MPVKVERDEVEDVRLHQFAPVAVRLQVAAVQVEEDGVGKGEYGCCLLVDVGNVFYSECAFEPFCCETGF